jgi:hypothetical protein
MFLHLKIGSLDPVFKKFITLSATAVNRAEHSSIITEQNVPAFRAWRGVMTWTCRAQRSWRSPQLHCKVLSSRMFTWSQQIDFTSVAEPAGSKDASTPAPLIMPPRLITLRPPKPEAPFRLLIPEHVVILKPYVAKGPPAGTSPEDPYSIRNAAFCLQAPHDCFYTYSALPLSPE